MSPTPTPEDLVTAADILRRGSDPRRSFCLAAARVVGADSVTLWEVEGGELRLTASTEGDAVVEPPDWRRPLGPRSAAGRAAADGVRFFSGDPPGFPEADAGPAAQRGLQSILAEPVRISGRPTGAIVFGWREPVEDLDPLVVGFLSLMTVQAAMAIGRTDLARRLERQALTDPLTDLLNRRGLARELDREMARAARRGSWLGFALMDLDNFKAYNDRFGHPAGDALLIRAVRGWSSRIRTQDILSRYGGEEFVLLLPDCGVGPMAPLEIVERVRSATPDGQTVSAGLAIWDGDEPAHRLAERADGALYEAKASGRNRTLAAA